MAISVIPLPNNQKNYYSDFLFKEVIYYNKRMERYVAQTKSEKKHSFHFSFRIKSELEMIEMCEI